MSVKLTFKICTYLLVVDGLIALALAGLIAPSWWPFIGMMVAASWWGEAIRLWVSAVVRRRHLITVLAVGFFILDLLYLAESLLDGFVHLLVFALFYKLYTWRTLRDARDLLLLAFFTLVAASPLTVNVGFLFVFLVFLLLGSWTFMLYHVMSESERHVSGDASALIESRDLVTPALLGLSLFSAAAVFIFTLAFFFTIPRLGQAALPFRSGFGPMISGFSDRVELGSFGTIQTDATVVMRVHFPEGPAVPELLGGLRWRGLALDHFSGREWSVTQAERQMARRSTGGYIPLARPRGRGVVVTQEVYLEPMGTDVLFAAPRILGMVLSRGTVWVDPLGSVTSPIPVARLRYRAVSELETPTVSNRVERALSDEERAQYLQLPTLSPEVPALAHKVIGGSPDRWTAALRLTDYFQSSFRYSLELERSGEMDPLEDFLFGSRAGNCEYFATSLAVLLRTLGIPARVVNGFQRGVWNPYGRYFTVRKRDAHSWVEAYFPERGWMTLDPSPREGFDAAWAPSQTLQYLDALRMRWHRYVVNWSLGDQMRASWFVRERAGAWRRALFNRGLSFPGGTRWATIAVAAAGGLALAIFLWRRPAILRSAGLRHRSTVPAYERMVKRLARQGLSREQGETAREFRTRVLVELPDLRDPVDELTLAYERVRFGGSFLGQEELARLWRLADGLAIRRERPAVRG